MSDADTPVSERYTDCPMLRGLYVEVLLSREQIEQHRTRLNCPELGCDSCWYTNSGCESCWQGGAGSACRLGLPGWPCDRWRFPFDISKKLATIIFGHWVDDPGWWERYYLSDDNATGEDEEYDDVDDDLSGYCLGDVHDLGDVLEDDYSEDSFP